MNDNLHPLATNMYMLRKDQQIDYNYFHWIIALLLVNLYILYMQ